MSFASLCHSYDNTKYSLLTLAHSLVGYNQPQSKQLHKHADAFSLGLTAFLGTCDFMVLAFCPIGLMSVSLLSLWPFVSIDMSLHVCVCMYVHLLVRLWWSGLTSWVPVLAADNPIMFWTWLYQGTAVGDEWRSNLLHITLLFFYFNF